MTSSSEQAKPQTLSPTFIAITLLGVAYVVAAFAVLQLGSRNVGLLMLAPVAIGLLVSVVRTPREQWSKLAAAQQKHRETPVGRAIRILEWVTLLLIAASALDWLHVRL